MKKIFKNNIINILIKYLSDFKLRLTFNDCKTTDVDFEPFLKKVELPALPFSAANKETEFERKAEKFLELIRE